MRTIVTSFLDLCRQEPERLAFIFVDEKGKDVAQLTRWQLHLSARAVAHHLLEECHLKAGSSVLLIYPQSLDFVVAFLGCLYAGIIPIPTPPPDPFRDIKQDLEILRNIVDAFQCSAILTNGTYSHIKKISSLKNFFTSSNKTWSELPWYRTDNIIDNVDDNFAINKPLLSDIAYCQFTSGSTSDPKGVTVTFANLVHQISALAARLDFNDTSTAVIWMPQYHSTCLVSVILTALQLGGLVYFLSPLAFLKNPAVWFDVITRTKATHTTAPNFALTRMVEHTTLQQRQLWNLNSLKVLCVGGESNYAHTAASFIQEFSIAGFNPNAYCPGYGMTEHTLGIAMTDYNESYSSIEINKSALQEYRKFVSSQTNFNETTDIEKLQLISCGKPLKDVKIKIVATETGVECQSDEVGEIWVASPSVTPGYYNTSSANMVFSGKLPNELDNYLRTGDMGIMIEGYLYVTGRLKDIIIINGRNIAANDIESVIVDCHPLIVNNRVVAFRFVKLEDEEQIAVAVELNKSPNNAEINELVTKIRTELAKKLQVSCHKVILCQENTFLLTSTGKIRRQPTGDAILADKLETKQIFAISNF